MIRSKLKPYKATGYYEWSIPDIYDAITIDKCLGLGKKTKPKKESEKPKELIIKTLDELKQIKELKDQVEALKARITRKDATIKSLKRRLEKLKNPVEKKKEETTDHYIDNPDFLEIL
jgi:predicted RNase H-like nuclease (RuvC/YqgF family)